MYQNQNPTKPKIPPRDPRSHKTTNPLRSSSRALPLTSSFMLKQKVILHLTIHGFQGNFSPSQVCMIFSSRCLWLKAKLRTLLNSLQQALIHYFSIDGFCKLSCQEEFRHSVDNPASYCIILQMNHKFAETCWDVCGPSSNFTHHRSESPLSLRSSLEMQLPHPPPES